MSVSAVEALAQHAAGIADSGGSTDEMIVAAGGDRVAMEAARDHVAAMVRKRVDDYGSTATLRLLNRALSDMPRSDPLDWQVRWEQRRKP